MSVYYPQAAMRLTVTWEDFKINSPVTKTDKLYVVAREVKVDINSYHEADKFSATLDYKTFPFDPRTVRAIGVTVYMANLGGLYESDGVRRRQLKISTENTDNVVFQGFVDDESIDLSEDDRIISMEGRDFTSLFIDTTRDVGKPVPLGMSADKVILALMNERGIKKVVSQISLDPRISGKLPIISKQADKNSASGKKNPKKNETYWDIIQSVARRAGLIAFIELDKLVLTAPQNLYEKNIRTQMIYGNNLSSLTFKRKIGRRKAQNVIVYAMNLRTKKREKVILPQDAKGARFKRLFGNKPATQEQFDANGKKIEPPKLAEAIPFRVAGVQSRDALIAVGEGIYEEISRQHLEGELSTNEMTFEVRRGKERVRSGFNHIRVGTAIEVSIRQDDLDKISSTNNLDDRIRYLRLRGYPQSIATQFAKSLTKVKAFYTFFTRSVNFSLGQSGGFSMSIDFINFIDIGNRAYGGRKAELAEQKGIPEGVPLSPNELGPSGTGFGVRDPDTTSPFEIGSFPVESP